MGKIHVLDIEVANLIAAGEVVERPANAVKELVENAIDAGAHQITVEIRRGGISFLRVTDDGSGMSAEDAVTAIRRHATSKIKAVSDLTAIATLGFRGEALAAITAVSAYRILTKRSEDLEGTLISGAYGKTEEITSAGAPNGTTVICERLFATTPARLKFLKSDAAESSAVISIMEKLAVSRPEIAFRMIADGNTKFTTVGDNILKNAIYAVYGREFANHLVAVSGGTRGIRAEGYISSPDFVRSNRAMQQFFINNRSVRSKTLAASLEAAFASYLAPSKYPACVLNIETSPTLVDVNIHPAKLEVKFSDEKAVFDALYSAVRTALTRAVSRPILAITEEAIREDGNRQIAEVPFSGEQTKLDLLFQKASDKGEKSEQHTPQAAPTRENSVEIPKKNEGKTELSSVSSEKAPSSLSAMLYGAPNSKKSPPSDDDDDICVDVPIIKAAPEPTRRIALASDSNIGDFEARARLYGKKAKNGVRSALDEIPPKYEPIKEAPAPEKAPLPPSYSTDAEIPGKTAKPIPPYRIIGEAFASYVILEAEDKILLIDKHAAHERIQFERMRAAMNADRPNTRLLLVHETITLTAEEAAACLEYADELSRIGFSFKLDEKSITILGIPEDESVAGAKELLHSLLTDTMETGKSIASGRREIFEKALYQSACKSAVKAGRVYDEAHIRWICDNLLRYDCIKFCPHGRPVAFELSKKELDHRFGRT